MCKVKISKKRIKKFENEILSTHRLGYTLNLDFQNLLFQLRNKNGLPAIMRGW